MKIYFELCCLEEFREDARSMIDVRMEFFFRMSIVNKNPG